MALDALRQRNVIQLVGILREFTAFSDVMSFNLQVISVFHLAMVVFAAIQVHETSAALSTAATTGLFPHVEPFLIVVPCVVAAAWCGMIWTVRELYSEFGCVLLRLRCRMFADCVDSWAIFRVVGANPTMKSKHNAHD